METHSKNYFYKGKTYKVYFVDKNKIAPCFGIAYQKGYAEVRNDLNFLVKRFVIKHELYHLGDTKKWGGVLGRELRANFIPGFKDPIGLIACIITTFISKDRMRFYLDRIKNKY